MSREVHVRFCESRGVRLPPATHLVVLVAGTREHAEHLCDVSAAVLQPMGLILSDAKTKIVHIDEGFDFLGYRIQRHQKRGTEKRFIYCYPSKAALANVKAKLRTLTQGATDQPLNILLHRINPVLRGWTNSDIWTSSCNESPIIVVQSDTVLGWHRQPRSGQSRRSSSWRPCLEQRSASGCERWLGMASG
jgi:hypothetical protein